MDNDVCSVTIDGRYAGTYYVACQYVSYLENGSLYNNGSNTISLYPSKNHETYPRISVSSLSLPFYYTSSNFNGSLISDISRTDFNLYSQLYRFNSIYAQPLLLLALLLVVFNRLLRGRGK